MVAMIAELLVRTFTVILLEAANGGGTTRLLGTELGRAPPAPARNLSGGMVCYWPRTRIVGREQLV
ncbi:hypothetical protein GCM10009837_09260 [Streptomyces durmitorensis]